MLIVAGAALSSQDIEGAALPPAWRKATRNMILATRSIELAMARAPLLLERARADLGLVVGSNSGEIDTSADFVVTLAQSGMARPLLFQNSLHNATTGFASIHFGITGPAFTISDGARTAEEAVFLARMLLNEKLCRAVIVTLVEAHRAMAAHIKEDVNEGACTLIFAAEDLVSELGLRGRPVPTEISKPYPTLSSDHPLVDLTSTPFFHVAYDSQLSPA